MSTSDSAVMGKPPSGTPGSRNRTPSTTPRSTTSTPRQSTTTGRTGNNARPSGQGQTSKRSSSVTSETEATLRRKIERLKLELDTKKTKPKRGSGDGKSLTNRATSNPTAKNNSSSESKDSSKIRTPPNSSTKSNSARRSLGPDAKTKPLPAWRSGGSGDVNSSRSNLRVVARVNSKPDLLKKSNTKPDMLSTSSSSSTGLNRKETFIVKKSQSNVSTRIPTIRGSPKAEITKTDVEDEPSKQSIPMNVSSDISNRVNPPSDTCSSKESVHRSIPKMNQLSITDLTDDDQNSEQGSQEDFPKDELDRLAQTRKETTLDGNENGLPREIESQYDGAIIKEPNMVARSTLKKDLDIHDGEELLQNEDLSSEMHAPTRRVTAPDNMSSMEGTDQKLTTREGHVQQEEDDQDEEAKENLENMLASQKQLIHTLKVENANLLETAEQIAPITPSPSITPMGTPRGMSSPPPTQDIGIACVTPPPEFTEGSISGYAGEVVDHQGFADVNDVRDLSVDLGILLPESLDFDFEQYLAFTPPCMPPSDVGSVTGSINGSNGGDTEATAEREASLPSPDAMMITSSEETKPPAPVIFHGFVTPSDVGFVTRSVTASDSDETEATVTGGVQEASLTLLSPDAIITTSLETKPPAPVIPHSSVTPSDVGPITGSVTPSDIPNAQPSTENVGISDYGEGTYATDAFLANIANDFGASDTLCDNQIEGVVAHGSAPLVDAVSPTVSSPTISPTVCDSEVMPGDGCDAVDGALFPAAGTIDQSITGTNDQSITDTIDRSRTTDKSTAGTIDQPGVVDRESRNEETLMVVAHEEPSMRKQVEELQQERRPNEERYEKLKKRNMELSLMTKRLDEKARQIQIQKRADTPPSLPNGTATTNHQTSKPTDVEVYKRLFARQRARDLAESAQKLLTKEKEIKGLKQELDKRVALSPEPEVQNGNGNDENTHLKTIIKGNAKEQLLLQRQIQLASSVSDTQTNGLGSIRYQTIEETNRALRRKCTKLQQSQEEFKLSEVEVTQQRLACETLEKDLLEERRKCTDLSADYQNVLIHNTALSRKNTELQNKLALLEHVNKECQKLRIEVNEQHQLFENTALERDILHEKVEKLEVDVSLMQDAEEKRRALEREYDQAIRELRDKQEEIRKLQQDQQVAKRDHHDSVSRLAAKVKDLERKCDEQSSNFSRLSNELLALRNEAGSQLFTMTATGSTNNSKGRPDTGVGAASSPRKGVLNGGGDKEDWRKIAEEAAVTRTLASTEAQRLGNEPKGSRDEADIPIATDRKTTTHHVPMDLDKRKTNSSKGVENGQLDTSDAEDLMEDLSDRIDAAILNRLNQASSITTMGPISKLAVFIARYNYDPYRDSPNDNPDAELPLTAGDYIYVYGDPDEDGFYEGELMDGQRGLVPCNFIERVAEEDLPGFMNSNAMESDASKLDSLGSSGKYSVEGALPTSIKPSHDALLPDTPAAIGGSVAVGDAGEAESNVAQKKDDMNDLEFNSEEEDLNRGNLNHFAGDLQSFNRTNEHHSDLEDIPEVDEVDNGIKGHSHVIAPEDGLTSLSDIASDYVFDVPCPKKLTLERQLKNSIIISWLLPDTIAPQEVHEYRVYVNGQFRTATKWDAKTRALVENIRPLETYRISVRTVTSKGMSEDAACTIMIGKDASAAPSELKASNVSPTCADISWLPGNSNLAHQVSVNGKETQLLKPSLYRYALTGLSPLSVYRVNVRAKSRKTSQDNSKEKLAAEIEFKTLPGGLPDAPLDVQVLPGPSTAVCLVEWLPVTITTSGLSNGAVVTGYAVYAEDTKVAEIFSPTADRVSMSLNKIKLLSAKDVVVRTLSPNGFSIDSVPARIPPALLEERRGDATLRAMEAKHSQPSNMYHGAEEEVDTSSHSSRSDEHVAADRAATTTTTTHKPPAAASSGKAAEQSDEKEDTTKKVDARLSRDDYTSESERSELSDIAEEAEEELSDFADGSLPGFSDNSETKSLKRSRRREDEQKKKVQETLKFNAKPEMELDTDPELESLNRSDKCLPIQVIRQQCDFERETEQSPHNQVVEPIPIKQSRKEGKTVPHIEITQDEARKAANEKRSEPSGQSSLHQQQPSQDLVDRTKSHSNDSNGPSHQQRKNSPGDDRQVALKLANYKDYDAKSNNDRQRKLSMDSRTEETGTYEEEEDYSVSEGPEELFDDSVIRFFVALYDYDPTAMSPNDDAADEELTFKEGDIIKVFGDKDADGFFMGELNSQRGFVPYNMVEEVDGPEQTPLNPPKRPSTTGTSMLSDSPDRVGYSSSLNTTASSPVHLFSSPITSLNVGPDARRQRMRALFDYNPQELSPNPDAEAELSFRQGELIMVYGEMDNDGFYVGELHGERGLVPSNFLEVAVETPRPESVPSPQQYSSPAHQPYSPSHQSFSHSPGRDSRGSRGSRGSYSSVRSDDRQTQLQTRHQENGEALVKGRDVRSNSDAADQSGDSMGTPEHIKKKKGLLSKGKALFKKLGGDSKQKHK